VDDAATLDGVHQAVALNPGLPNSGYAQLIVMTRGIEARERDHAQLGVFPPPPGP